MEYFDRIQLAYQYARQSRGVLSSVLESMSADKLQVAIRNGREQSARIMMRMYQEPGYRFAVKQEDIEASLHVACLGNKELASHYGDQLGEFSRSFDGSRDRVMQELGELYQVRVSRIPQATVESGPWGNTLEWDACIIQNPEMAAISPYAGQGSYSRAERESRLRLHEHLQECLRSGSFECEDVCRLMLEDKGLEIGTNEYRQIVEKHLCLASLLPSSVLRDEKFRDALLQADPIMALRQIPPLQQTDQLRLKAISMNAEAYRWIDDDDFKRRHFVMPEMNAMRLGSSPSAEQRELVQRKAAALLDAYEHGSPAQLETMAERNWLADASENVQGSETNFLSETAQYHWHDGVSQHEDKQTYSFYEDAQGSLEYEPASQRFWYTTHEGERTDMTESMDALRQNHVPFQSLGEAQRQSFLHLKDFSYEDAQGEVREFIAQQGSNGLKSYIGKLSSQAMGKAMSVATGKAIKLWDDAMSAGQL